MLFRLFGKRVRSVCARIKTSWNHNLVTFRTQTVQIYKKRNARRLLALFTAMPITTLKVNRDTDICDYRKFYQISLEREISMNHFSAFTEISFVSMVMKRNAHRLALIKLLNMVCFGTANIYHFTHVGVK